MPRPPSPPSDRRWQPRYPRERDRPRSYRDFEDRDRDYDRRDRERDEYRPPAPPARRQTYRGRRDYASPPPARGRDRSWERERDYRDRERDYERDRDRDRDRDLPRKRTRSPSPRGVRRFSPPPERYVPRVEYPPGYERPKRESTPKADVVDKVEGKKEVETGEYSEEEGMVTPPQGKKRKLEPEVEPKAEPPAEPVEPRKPRLVVVSEPKKRILESPPHQSKSRLGELAQTTPVVPSATVPVPEVPTSDVPAPERSRSPIKISLPTLSLTNKPKPNTPTIPAGPAFGVEEKDERRPVSPARHDDRQYRGPPARDTRRPSAWASNERTDRGRDRRYSTSSSWASRSRSPPRGSAVRPRSRSPDVRRRRSISPRPDTAAQRYRPGTRRSRSRSISPRSPRSPRSDSSRSRSTRSRSRSRISRSRTRSPVQPLNSVSRAAPFRRNVRPPTGPAAETPVVAPVPEVPVRAFIPTGPRGRGRGPPIAPRAPRAERLGFVGGFRGAVRPVVGPTVVASPGQSIQAAPGAQVAQGVQNTQNVQSVQVAPNAVAPPIPAPPSTVAPKPTPVVSVAPVPTPVAPVAPTATPVPPTIIQNPVVTVAPSVPTPEHIEPTPILEPPKAPQAELVTNREERIKIQLRPEPPAPIIVPPKLLASSPVAMPQSSPATPFEKPTASPATKIGSSPMDRGSATPASGPVEERHEPARKPSFITLPPPPANARSRASSSAIPPTPAARTPHPAPPPHNLRQAASYSRLPVWKEYPPPAEVRYRERPNVADGLDALQALGAVLPADGYRAIADRDTTRIAGEWERQLMKLQHERALLTHTFQAIASNLRVKKFELGNALDEVWVAERKIEAAGMSMETAGFSPRRE